MKVCAKVQLLAWVATFSISIGSMAAVEAPRQRFNVVSADSAVTFTAIGKPSALKIVGKAAGPQGQALVNGGKLSGEFHFDLKTLETGITMRDTHMKDKYLEVGKYPEAVLTIKDLPFDLSKPSQVFKGTLLLHGVERPVEGMATINPVPAAAGDERVVTDFTLKTSDFGIDVPKFAGITVTDSVQVNVSLHAQAAQP